MPELVTELIVPGRFNGPPSSGNGGWTAGAVAGALALDPDAGRAAGCPENRADSWPPVEVSLRQPPPLDTPMQVEHHGVEQGVEQGVDGDAAGVDVSFGGALVAGARCVDRALHEVAAVGPEEARAAEASYPGLHGHPFPTCFVCGPAREEGDGLRIFGGRVADVAGLPRLAATWTPARTLVEDWHAYVDDEPRASLAATWAALDCIGGWAGDMTERLMVLGRMTARIDALPVIGEEHVVVGARLGQEGRKTFTASTLHDADGRVVGTAEHLWIAVDPSAFT